MNRGRGNFYEAFLQAAKSNTAILATLHLQSYRGRDEVTVMFCYLVILYGVQC